VRKDSDGYTSRAAVRASQHQQGNGFEDDFNESMGDTEEFPDDARGIQDVRSILMRPQNQTFSVPSWESYPAKLWMESFTGLWSAPMCKSRSPYECINEEKMGTQMISMNIHSPPHALYQSTMTQRTVVPRQSSACKDCGKRTLGFCALTIIHTIPRISCKHT